MLKRRDVLRGALVFGAVGAVWTTQMHRFLEPSARAVEASEPLSARAHAAATTLVRRAGGGAQRKALRRFNAEWDLLERMIGGLALACVAFRSAERHDEAAAATREMALAAHHQAREYGHITFLLPYARHGRWRGPERSLFVDGEIAHLLGTALMLNPGDAALRSAFEARIRHVVSILERSSMGGGESYPDECWTFCNMTALAALRMAEVHLGHDHAGLQRAFLTGIRKHLIHEPTGLLQSAFTWRGEISQPPEGSSLWWSTHALRLFEPELARDQYQRSVAELVARPMGFAYAREWPEGVEAAVDIDSGAIVPGLGASPASSGLALVAARSFGDTDLARALWASVELAGFPDESNGESRLKAGNALGDAVAAYGLVQGPVWNRLGAS